MAGYGEHSRKVYACALQNDTDSDVHVVVTYAAIPDRQGVMKQARTELDIEKGKKKYTLQKLVTRVTHNIIEVIESIEVSRIKGAKLELKAPFAGVKTPVTDWLFVITNTEIKSSGINPVG